MGAPVDHKRMKPKAGAKPTAAERLHMERVAGLPCLVSGRRPVTIHHVTAYADKPGRFARSHRLIVPLLARWHLIQHGPRGSVEALGHRGFFLMHGIDLLKEAKRIEFESIELGILPTI